MFNFFTPPITAPVNQPVMASQPVLIAQSDISPREAFIRAMADQIKRSWCFSQDIQLATARAVMVQVYAAGYGNEAEHMYETIQQYATFVSVATCD